MTTTIVSVDEARLRTLIEKAEKFDAGQRAGAPAPAATEVGAGDEPAAGGKGQRGAALRERIASQVLRVQRDYYPGSDFVGDGPLADLSPGQRSFAAHLALAIESHPNAQKALSGGFAPGAMVRNWLGGSGKRFNSPATAGIGAELVENAPLTEIWKGALCRSDLLQRFDPKPMKGKSLKIVNLTGVPQVYSTPPADTCNELECRTSSQVGTRTHEHQVGKLSVDLCLPVELEEDSFMDVVAEYTEIAEEQMRLAMERAIIRGDASLSGTTNINNNGAALTLTAAGQAPHWTVWDGLAHATLEDNSANNAVTAGLFTAGGSIVANDLMKIRALMWDAASARHWGFCDPSRLIYIVDAQTYAKLITLDDVKWVEKVGDGATILTGALPTIWGVPIHMSPSLELTANNGKVDVVTPANNTRGQAHLVNLDGFRLGVARDVEVVVEVDKRCDVVHASIMWRGAFARRASAATAAGIEAVASIYGIAAA